MHSPPLEGASVRQHFHVVVPSARASRIPRFLQFGLQLALDCLRLGERSAQHRDLIALPGRIGRADGWLHAVCTVDEWNGHCRDRDKHACEQRPPNGPRQYALASQPRKRANRIQVDSNLAVWPPLWLGQAGNSG
jgi:hypothetical protein